jgi:xyloglucan-specific exo-beta-1,4-glucanase
LRIGNSQLATSNDIGVTWTLNNATGSGGTIAYAADASVIVWTQPAANLLITNTTSTGIETLPTGVAIAADKVKPNYFYAGDTSGIYVSNDGGQTFNTTAKITSFSTPRIKAHPAIAGDIWLSTDQGLFHSIDFGASFTQIPNVQTGNDIAIGKESFVYSFNTIGNVAALRLSKDQGESWEVISDSGHGFGSQTSNYLAASMEIEGLVFVGTNGRGMFYGLP